MEPAELRHDLRVTFEDPFDGNNYYGEIVDFYYNVNKPETLTVDILWDGNVDPAQYYHDSRVIKLLRPVHKLPRGNPNREFKEENAYGSEG